MVDALQKSTRNIRITPGLLRLDTTTNETARTDDAFTVLDNSRLDKLTLSRRLGSKKVHTFTDPTDTEGSLALSGADYVFFTPPVIPLGGFGFKLSIKATRPSGGNTAYILSSKVAGKAYGPLTITLSDAGVISCSWRKESDETPVTATLPAVAADALVHLLGIYDPQLETWTVYQDGAQAAQVTSVGDTEQPMQDGPSWYFGTDTDGAGAPVANTGFDGNVDAWCLFSFAGVDITGGNAPLLTELREFSWQEWSNPGSKMVLSCYDFNGSGTVKDRSRFKNDCTTVGSPVPTAGVAQPSVPGNYVGVLHGNFGRRDNIVARGGELFYETTAKGSV